MKVILYILNMSYIFGEDIWYYLNINQLIISFGIINFNKRHYKFGDNCGGQLLQQINYSF